ncbi:hypothetical protein PLESTM_000165300 [Pleodorina starrii]|nr:hypothetical protein PLESTM_000165300 [Pleodorina starrii]
MAHTQRDTEAHAIYKSNAYAHMDTMTPDADTLGGRNLVSTEVMRGTGRAWFQHSNSHLQQQPAPLSRRERPGPMPGYARLQARRILEDAGIDSPSSLHVLAIQIG